MDDNQNKHVNPYRNNELKCPVPQEGEVGICVNICETDGDCAGGKCCKNACGGTYCISPTPEDDDTPEPIQCIYEDAVLNVGDRIRASDGCNTCICKEEYGLICTNRVCGGSHNLEEQPEYSVGQAAQDTQGKADASGAASTGNDNTNTNTEGGSNATTMMIIGIGVGVGISALIAIIVGVGIIIRKKRSGPTAGGRAQVFYQKYNRQS
eukprot:TRINITY_DN6445_c0_g1_i2.p1 TRINITY_DN6445_c0_g1~~TRINITY_DN6445_c0_g1_i2.p1  ORF type:complete len:242 (+),score=39.76 TRINITY_DN6445_c0_g1_i2:102-728(+)